MAIYKTPGVYVEEISTLPASVAPVATAIPAFVGYTQKRERSGETIPLNKPVRITSLLDYLQIFGGPFPEEFGVRLTGTLQNSAITIVEPADFSPYLLYYQVRMYFTNGGGPCYIVSVGDYVTTQPSESDIVVTDLVAGVNAVEEEDEPTLLVVPEAILLSDTERKTVYDQMLAQCNKLQDRFSILDAAIGEPTVEEDAIEFRNTVGSSNLKYGAAYYPTLKTDIFRYIHEGSVLVEDNRPSAGNGPFHGFSLDTISNAGDLAIGQIVITDNSVVDGDTFSVDGSDFVEGTDFDKGADATSTAAALAAAVKAAANPNYTVSQVGNVVTITATAGAAASALDYTDSGSGDAASLSGASLEVVTPDKGLYNKIVEKLQGYTMDLYPCGSVAGIYARVDRERGVWKAPANVDVRGMSAPGVLVSSEDQHTLNVHPGTGKSINVIRKFAGKGNLVWGARTLAGNDNEWRYIPVRRLFIFVEESVKKATEFVVFEPNDANTWLRVKTMIENFLAKLWRDGALAGAKAEDAFFVRVGLGQTMTALDILEGIMNIEIGMAAVRPAEFIILKFSHKLQES